MVRVSSRSYRVNRPCAVGKEEEEEEEDSWRRSEGLVLGDGSEVVKWGTVPLRDSGKLPRVAEGFR